LTTITESTRFEPGIYRVGDTRGRAIFDVAGDDLTLDFTGVVIDGSKQGARADQFGGTGLRADGCKRLTVKNLTVRGCKVGMHFVDCEELTVTGCDVSDNYRQRLRSTSLAEDVADWLWPHENDDDQWLRYGAGIYVAGSKRATIANNRARRGQNGLCLVRVDDSTIVDNDFSFLSGWGVAMWRSSRNDVSNNKLDWCIRGFSHGVYHRGQDSAAILVFEQCNDNVFARNSATHGGDGFFLHAGNETVERTGVGGCNRNIVYENDFSHAAANGIECTFSEGNVFVANRLEECEHAVWAGYSYGTTICENVIRNCAHGVSIEHGHENRIESNLFESCGIGVNLWADDEGDFARKPFARRHDTSSREYVIVRNRFERVTMPTRIANTKNVVTDDDEVPPLELRLPPTKGTRDTRMTEGARRGRRWIVVDEWGPRDVQSGGGSAAPAR
jgi:parallel beta-helix repeat protein